MNKMIKPYFDQLIEDRVYSHSTEPAPMEMVKNYIEALEEIINDAYDGFEVVIEKDLTVMS